MKRLTALFILVGSPATAATGSSSYDFTSLFNTDFVVLIGFLLFVAIIFYFNVPSMLMGMLDNRAKQIKAELDEARALREEAQTILASYERKQREVAEQSERIVAQAREEAAQVAEEAKADLKASIARRLQAAEDQISNAEQKALREVRDHAVDVAIAAASKLIADQTSATEANKLIDAAIDEVETRLN